MSYDIDFGTAFHKPNGNAVKVTVNEFRDKLYLHIREYSMDGDTGQWYPTKSGFAISADETASLIPLLEQASNMVAQRFTSTSQLEFNFGEINER
tara:strand:- start:4351 stop:4635 length:285 start_codon:yes stop_codon:yes gene_type:complete